MQCALKMTRQLILFDSDSAMRELRCNPVRINNTTVPASLPDLHGIWLRAQKKIHHVEHIQNAKKKQENILYSNFGIIYEKSRSFGAKFSRNSLQSW